MRLQIWRKMVDLERVGLPVLFFMPALWQVQFGKPTFFLSFFGSFYGMAVKRILRCFQWNSIVVFQFTANASSTIPKGLDHLAQGWPDP
jgi:hypothetical protein